jgi:hypothetical protein
MNHPFFDMLREQMENYFHVERTGCTWYGFGKPVYVPAHRRPLGEIFTPLLEAGFALEKLVEPLPTDDFRRAEPKDYERLLRQPGFLCIRARKG